MALLNTKRMLWKDGESTLGFIAPELPFSKQKRFKLYSIYWPEKSQSVAVIKNKKSADEELVRKISRQIDEQEKNELRMTKGKKSFVKTAKNTTGGKDGFTSFRQTKATKLSKQNQEIVRRLARTTDIRQSLLRDRHGHRTNIFENQEDQFLERLKGHKQFRSTEKGFYTSKRVKLELPHNYYPGPGSYQIKRYLENERRPRSQHIS